MCHFVSERIRTYFFLNRLCVPFTLFVCVCVCVCMQAAVFVFIFFFGLYVLYTPLPIYRKKHTHTHTCPGRPLRDRDEVTADLAGFEVDIRERHLWTTAIRYST